MILAWLLIITLAAGLLAWVSSRWSTGLCRWISLAALFLDLVLVLTLWRGHSAQFAISGNGPWLAEVSWNWIPELGIGFHLAADGLSLLLLLLTVFLGIISVAASWDEIQERVGFFHFNLMFVLGGILGVFMVFDLFLFYFFWELMLVPMYFLISIWGHENRVYAAIKFFIFTQASGLLMLLAILGLYFIHGRTTATYTFDYSQILGTPLAEPAAKWLLLGFFVAFAVKLPAVPLHTWLPDAHTQAPTAGSVILAGLMLKTGAYGMLRFAVPLFPEAARDLAPAAMLLGVVAILYGAILAFAQTDLKRLIAYTSVSHLGFVLLGIAAWNKLALQGAVIIILAHGLTTGALFVMAGALQERIHTRDMNRMGGLWSKVPRMGGVAMFFALASLGLPGLANFVGEFLVLVGAYKVSPTLAAVAALGLVASSIYSLWIIMRAFHGESREEWHVRDMGLREMAVFSVMMAGVIWLGLYPQPVLSTAEPALETLRKSAAQNIPDRLAGNVDPRISEADALRWQTVHSQEAAGEFHEENPTRHVRFRGAEGESRP